MSNGSNVSDNTMSCNQPYLLRAMYEWICDNDCTPYLYIDTEQEGLKLPEHLVGELPLILNIAPTACKSLSISNESVTFSARFSGSVFHLFLPMASVMAIVARENGQGMQFPREKNQPSQSETDSVKKKNTTAKKSTQSKSGSGLKIIR